MIKARLGTVAAYSQAEVPSLAPRHAPGMAPGLQRDGRSPNSTDMQFFPMSAHA